MIEVLKAFLFFAAGITLSEIYKREAWKKYREGLSDGGGKPVDMKPGRYMPRGR